MKHILMKEIYERKRDVGTVESVRMRTTVPIRPIGEPGAWHVMQIMHIERRVNLRLPPVVQYPSVPFLSVSCQLVVQGE